MEGRRPHDDLVGSLLDQRPRTLDGAHSAADTANGPRSQQLHQSVIRAAADGRIEIDHLNLRKGGELFQHRQRRIAFERLLAALNELHNLAIHQIDTGENQGVFLTGMPWRSSCSFRSETVYVP